MKITKRQACLIVDLIQIEINSVKRQNKEDKREGIEPLDYNYIRRQRHLKNKLEKNFNISWLSHEEERKIFK